MNFSVVDRIINHLKLRLAANTFRDLLLALEERSVRFQELLSVPAAIWPGMSNSRLPLTSLRAAIYTSSRWLDG